MIVKSSKRWILFRMVMVKCKLWIKCLLPNIIFFLQRLCSRGATTTIFQTTLLTGVIFPKAEVLNNYLYIYNRKSDSTYNATMERFLYTVKKKNTKTIFSQDLISFKMCCSTRELILYPTLVREQSAEMTAKG